MVYFVAEQYTIKASIVNNSPGKVARSFYSFYLDG